MGKLIAFIYGSVSYVVFLAAFLYSIGFVGNIVVPKSIDSGTEAPFVTALVVNIALLLLFAVQHNVMARPAFKKWWTRIVPTSIERSTYVLLSSLILMLLFWQWRPMTGVIWNVDHSIVVLVLHVIFWLGWLTVLLSTFMINHSDLFGLRQVYLNLRGQKYTMLAFKKTGLYRIVRHPLMMGFIIAFWSTPVMTAGHFLFAGVTTVWILFSIQLEESDLADFHEEYKDYKKDTPMVIPIPKAT